MGRSNSWRTWMVLSAGVELPMGLGSRHIAAAAISKRPGVVAIAASQSGVVRVFCEGEIVAVADNHGTRVTGLTAADFEISQTACGKTE